MGDGSGPGLLRQLHHLLRLADSFRRHAQGIEVAAQHIAIDQITQITIEQLRTGVYGVMSLGAQFGREALDAFQLLGTEAAGVDRDGGDLVTLLAQMYYAERGIQSTGECQYHVLRHLNSSPMPALHTRSSQRLSWVRLLFSQS